MIFVTIGSVIAFDRLVEAVDAVAAEHPDEDWFAQIGDGTYLPTHMAYARYVDRDEFERRVAEADLLIGHAGMGTISAALAAGKPLLVMPRDDARGEHVDDHQFLTADLFAADGHVLVAREAGDMAGMLDELRSFEPTPRESTAAGVGERVGRFLSDQQARRR